MVTFSEYVTIAHEVADEKGLSVDNPRQFMRDLGEVYRANDHAAASRSAAKDYLRRVVN